MAYIWSPSTVTLSEAGFTLSAPEQGAPLLDKIAFLLFNSRPKTQNRKGHPPQIHLLFKMKFQPPHKKLTLATQSNWQHSVELYILNPKSQIVWSWASYLTFCSLGPHLLAVGTKLVRKFERSNTSTTVWAGYHALLTLSSKASLPPSVRNVSRRESLESADSVEETRQGKKGEENFWYEKHQNAQKFNILNYIVNTKLNLNLLFCYCYMNETLGNSQSE